MLNPTSAASPFPENLLTAAAHPDPYPYYAALRAYRPIYREHALKLWVALGADVVAEILGYELCRVRPAAEPVPSAIANAPAGGVFRHLVRMNDGPRHAAAKAAVGGCLDALDPMQLTAVTRSEATLLARELTDHDPGEIDRFSVTLPVRVIARMIGLPAQVAATCATLIGDFVRCLSPLSTPAEIERSNQAASSLLELLKDELRGGQPGGVSMMVERMQTLGIAESEAVLANLVGLMSQTYEATAGLIGNTLLALARDGDLHRRAAGDDALLARAIDEVLRHDPPVQNTRRYLAQDATIAGQAMTQGDQILVVLAAANRDPARYRRPERFDPDRGDRGSLTFGAGRHACPGQSIATRIAAIGIQALIARGVAFDALRTPAHYRPSINARIPLFGGLR